MSKNIAIVFAGGVGARRGSGLPKQFIEGKRKIQSLSIHWIFLKSIRTLTRFMWHVKKSIFANYRRWYSAI